MTPHESGHGGYILQVPLGAKKQPDPNRRDCLGTRDLYFDQSASPGTGGGKQQPSYQGCSAVLQNVSCKALVDKQQNEMQRW